MISVAYYYYNWCNVGILSYTSKREIGHKSINNNVSQRYSKKPYARHFEKYVRAYSINTHIG